MFSSKRSSRSPDILLLPAFVVLILVSLYGSVVADPDVSLFGQVKERGSGQAVVSAEVILYPGGMRVLTDQDGQYRFHTARIEKATLVVNAEGYYGYESELLRFLPGTSISHDVILVKHLYSQSDQVVVSDFKPDHAGKIVISSDSPEFENARDLVDLLDNVSGVMLLSAGASGQSASISVGGAPARQTAVFVDGMALNSRLTGEVDLSRIPKEIVERIEIYTDGSGSSLGTGGLSGSVNIITRRSSKTQKSALKQELGSYSYTSTGMDLEHRFNASLSLNAMYSRTTSSNDFKYDDPRQGEVRRSNNYKQSTAFFINLDYMLENRGDLRLAFSEVSSNSGLPGAVFELTETASRSVSDRRLLFAGVYKLKPWWKVKSGGTYLLSYQHFSDYDSFIPYDSKYRDSRVNIYLENRFILSLDHQISTRLESEFSRFQQANMIKTDQAPLSVKEDRGQFGLSYDSRFDLPRNQVFEGIRFHLGLSQTASRLYYPLTSPLCRISLDEGAKSGFSMFASYSNTYRAPTYASLFWGEDAFSVGNPNLKPEKAEIFKCGLDYDFNWGGVWTFGIEYEHRYIRDLIYWTRRFDGKFFPRNLSRALVENVSFNSRWTLLDDLGQVRFSVSLCDPQDRSWETNYHDNDLAFYPRRIIDFCYMLTPGNFIFSIENRWVSKRYSRRANTKSLDPFSLTDMRFGIKQEIYLFEVKFETTVKNIFSESYELIERYPLPGRNYWLGISLTCDLD